MYKKTLKSVSKNALKATVSKKKSKALKYGRGLGLGFLKQKQKNDIGKEIPTSTRFENLDNRVIELELSIIPDLVQSTKDTNENIRILDQTRKYQFETLSGKLETLSGELENIRKDLDLFRNDLKGIDEKLALKEWKKD